MQKTILAYAVLLALASITSTASAGGSIIVKQDGVINTDLNIDQPRGVLTYNPDQPNQYYGIFGIFPDGHTASYLGSHNTITVNTIGLSYKNQKLEGIAIEALGGSNLTIGKAGSSTDITVVSDVRATGIRSAAGSTVSLNGESLTINVETTIDNGEAVGLYAQNSTTTAQEKDRARLIVNANNISVTAKSKTPGFATGLSAMSQGIMEINGNLEVKADSAILARGDSKVSINVDGQHTTKLTGDIEFNYDGPTSGTPIDSSVNVNLKGADSFWIGNVKTSYNELDPKKLEEVPNLLTVTSLSLGLSDGAQWTPTANQSSESSDSSNKLTGEKTIALNKLDLNNGTINVTGNDVNVEIEKLSGTGGTVKLATDLGAAEGQQTGSVIVDESVASSTLAVRLMDKANEKALTSDQVSADQAKALASNVGKNEQGQSVVKTTVDVKEGMYKPGYAIDEQGNTTTAPVNTLMQSNLELASAAPLAINRILMNDVRKRLGDIRSAEGTSGAWARYDGGRLSSSNGLENDFHTIQVGVDTQPTNDPVRFGVAFAYTMSDTDYARGTADMDAYSLAGYGLWLGENGQFVDVVARMATTKTDMTVDGTKKGEMDNVALSLSAEFGWRFDVINNFFVEPQIEGTYTYVESDNLTITDGTNASTYAYDTVDSFLGRVGVAFGMQCPNNKGNVYAHVSAVHEFLGDKAVTGGDGTVYSLDGKDTWVEYGLGTNFNVTPNTYLWADIERTSGGTLDEDYRATFGVRYSW